MNFKRLLWFAVLIGILAAGPAFAASIKKAQKHFPFGELKQRLILDGFAPQTIAGLYRRPQIEFDDDSAGVFFRHNEATLDYAQFAAPANITKAKTYLAAHGPTFEQVEKTYGVDRYVITAILLVETHLGNYTGGRRVVSILSTLAALAHSGPKAYFWAAIPSHDKPPKAKYDAWCERKSKWAYTELKALLTYCIRENIDPLTIQGSYAGAVGIPQFIPSRILQLAKDGDADGKINLFEHADAIASVANYLKHFGWSPDISIEKAREVVYMYNHSSYYVEGVLAVALKLKESQ